MFLQPGSEDFKEMRKATDRLQEQARLSAICREVEGADGLLVMGEGSFRAMVVENRVETRYFLLNKAKLLYLDQEARLVWSWPELEKCSSQLIA